jgi:hypothetical protein
MTQQANPTVATHGPGDVRVAFMPGLSSRCHPSLCLMKLELTLKPGSRPARNRVTERKKQP